jgi:hypothetical protein
MTDKTITGCITLLLVAVDEDLKTEQITSEVFAIVQAMK